jgi:restriction system protein
MGGSASNDVLLAKVIVIESIPEAVQSFIHVDNRQTKLGYNLAWAKTYLKRAGAIENSGCGVWSITAQGEQMTEADYEAVPATVRRQDYERKRARDDKALEPHGTATPASEESWKRAFECIAATLRVAECRGLLGTL